MWSKTLFVVLGVLAIALACGLHDPREYAGYVHDDGPVPTDGVIGDGWVSYPAPDDGVIACPTLPTGTVTAGGGALVIPDYFCYKTDICIIHINPDSYNPPTGMPQRNLLLKPKANCGPGCFELIGTYGGTSGGDGGSFGGSSGSGGFANGGSFEVAGAGGSIGGGGASGGTYGTGGELAAGTGGSPGGTIDGSGGESEGGTSSSGGYAGGVNTGNGGAGGQAGENGSSAGQGGQCLDEDDDRGRHHGRHRHHGHKHHHHRRHH